MRRMLFLFNNPLCTCSFILYAVLSVKTDLLPYGAVSRLYIANASQRDAGNYTCAISESSSTTVMVHILNGNKVETIRNLLKK